MSIFTPEYRFLTAGPTYYVQGNYLIAKSSSVSKLFSLFSYERRLLIDKESKMIRLSIKKWWFCRRVSELSFSRVKGILYEYKDHGTSWSVTPFWMGRTDSIEVFTVSLALDKPKEKLSLFNFVGEGSAATSLKGVILGGDDIFDLRGTQDNDSRAFIDTLTRFIGKNIIVSH